MLGFSPFKNEATAEVPNINIGRLKGKTIAGPKILLFPKDNAPAKAPKRDITGVPIKRLVNKITKLSRSVKIIKILPLMTILLSAKS